MIVCTGASPAASCCACTSIGAAATAGTPSLTGCCTGTSAACGSACTCLGAGTVAGLPMLTTVTGAGTGGGSRWKGANVGEEVALTVAAAARPAGRVGDRSFRDSGSLNPGNGSMLARAACLLPIDAGSATEGNDAVLSLAKSTACSLPSKLLAAASGATAGGAGSAAGWSMECAAASWGAAISCCACCCSCFAVVCVAGPSAASGEGMAACRITRTVSGTVVASLGALAGVGAALQVKAERGMIWIPNRYTHGKSRQYKAPLEN